MARGSAQAEQAGQTGLQQSAALGGQANNLFGSLAPALQTQMTHPQGMSPQDLAATTTAAQESAGGSNAGAVGQGALLAQRTKNRGAAGAAIGSAARGAQQTLGKAALATSLENARIKRQQQGQAMGEMGGLYGTTLGGAEKMLGIVPQAVNANTEAENASWNWAKYILDPAMESGAKAAAAFA